MYINDCDICQYVQKGDREVFSSEHWLVALSIDQSTLGRAYVTLKDHKGSLSDLTPGQWDDYIKVVKRVEHAWKKAFGADPLNWACMMNFAYQSKPFNPHVHWHVRPRYAEPVTFAGVTFDDSTFGYHYDPSYRREPEENILNEIVTKLQSNLD